MGLQWKITPAHFDHPGTAVTENGVIFSMVFRSCKECGLLLYPLKKRGENGERIRIPFTDKHRYGSLYSVQIQGLDPAGYAYRYYRDGETFADPYARELVQVKEGEETLCASKLFFEPEDRLPDYGTRKRLPWEERVIYCIHPKGFTASRTAKVRRRGTFAGIIEQIPYLKGLGVNALELLPVYELCRPVRKDRKPKPAEERLASLPNYWNFGPGCYFAPKAAYAKGSPQQEFREMTDALHEAGIDVYLQLYFPDSVSIQTKQETLRFYMTHFGVDGFHLKGSAEGLEALAQDPMLSDTSLLYYSFPYETLVKEDVNHPESTRTDVRELCSCTDSFQTLARRFVKSDNNVLLDFTKSFLDVEKDHGRVHYVTNYEGFTLADAVSYNWKHNEENGEDGRDGTDDNYTWNCGIEGKTQKKEIRALRMRQAKNLMAVNLLAQGTPLILAGDECLNSQGGNNNAWCQDNETGYVNWNTTKDARVMTQFTKDLLAFRKSHPILAAKTPFLYSDYKVTGYPDLSLHGSDAYKPDFSGYGHTIGIMFDEQYAEESRTHRLLYLALNMHWHSQRLGLPTPPKGTRWHEVMDTTAENPFHETPFLIADQSHQSLSGRSIKIFEAFPAKEDRPRLTIRTLSGEAKA